MTPNPALDTAIRSARYLLFAFNGPIRSTDTVEPADTATAPYDNIDSTTPTAPYIHEAFAACRESGRSIMIISTEPEINVPNYLDAHDLFDSITAIAASVNDAINFLEAALADCLVITSSVADIEAAQEAEAQSIGYARTAEEATFFFGAGAIDVVYSMAELALGIRARAADG